MNTLTKPKGKFEDLFPDKGWLLLRGVISTENVIEALYFLRGRLSEVSQAFRDWQTGAGIASMPYAEEQKRMADLVAKGLPEDFQHYLVGEFDLSSRLAICVSRLLALSPVMEAVSEFIGSPYLVHYPPMIRWKEKGAIGSIVPPHQDGIYSPHLKEFLTVWCPLVDIDEDCGGVIMYNGSHKAGPVPHGPTGSFAWGAKMNQCGYDHEPVHMKAGDLLLFPSNLLHVSAPHRAEHIRYSIDFRIFRSPECTSKSYFDPFEQRVVRQH